MSKTFVHEHRVGFAETDAAGVAHFSRFALWVEAAEAAFWRDAGESLARAEAGRLVGWPKVAFAIRYRSPAHFGDTVAVALQPRTPGNASLVWDFKIERSGTLLAEGEMTVLHAAITPTAGTFEKRLIPENLREILQL